MTKTKLTPTARMIYRIGRKAAKAAGRDLQNVSKLRDYEVAFLNAVGERHLALINALYAVMSKDGPGLDMSPAGECYKIARRALDEIR